MRGVIVEGIDCSGKSTLIKTLKLKLKKLGGFDVKELEHVECTNQYQRYLREYAINNSTLFDRSHVSEVVYGKLLRNSTPFQEIELNILNDVVKLEYVFVLAKVNHNDFMIRMQKSKWNQVIKKDQFEQIVQHFELVTKNFNTIIYDSTSYSKLEKISNEIVNILTRQSLS